MSGGDPGARHPVVSPGDAEHPRDLLASYALGLLEGDEHDRVEEHVRTCPTCAAELQELRAALDALPLAAAPVTPPPSAREALMARVSAAARAEPPAPRNVVAAPAPLAGGWVGGWGAAAGWTAALAGVALAGVSAWQLALARGELAALQQERAAAESRLAAQAEVLGQLDPQVTRITALRGSAQAAAVQGRVVYDSNSPTGLAVLEHLPPLQPDQVYQLWLIQGATPVSAGAFRPDPGGTGTLVIRAPNVIGSYSGLGLTAEREPGAASPTLPILASGAL